MGSKTRDSSPSKAALARKKGTKKAAKKATAKKVTVKKAGTKKASSRAPKATKPMATRPTSRKRRKPISRAKPTASAIEVDADVLEFIVAIDDYKKAHSRPFPSWSEVLHIVRALGYSK